MTGDDVVVGGIRDRREGQQKFMYWIRIRTTITSRRLKTPKRAIAEVQGIGNKRYNSK
jgi:hypothetical protein